MVCGSLVGDELRNNPPAPQPNKSESHQTKNVAMEQMPTRSQKTKTADQNLSADQSYLSLNGIAVKRWVHARFAITIALTGAG